MSEEMMFFNGSWLSCEKKEGGGRRVCLSVSPHPLPWGSTYHPYWGKGAWGDCSLYPSLRRDDTHPKRGRPGSCGRGYLPSPLSPHGGAIPLISQSGGKKRTFGRWSQSSIVKKALSWAIFLLYSQGVIHLCAGGEWGGKRRCHCSTYGERSCSLGRFAGGWGSHF